MPTDAEPSLAEFGRRLLYWRTERGLTQPALAMRLPGKSPDPNKISRYERGKHRPSEDLVRALADALEVPPEHFLEALPPERPVKRIQVRPTLTQFDRLEYMRRHVLEAVNPEAFAALDRIATTPSFEIYEGGAETAPPADPPQADTPEQADAPQGSPPKPARRARNRRAG